MEPGGEKREGEGGGEGRGRERGRGEGRGNEGTEYTSAAVTTEFPHDTTHLDWFLNLQGWNQDGHHQGDVLLHGAVLGNQQHQGQNERDHSGVAELGPQSRKDPLVDHTLLRSKRE